MTEFKIGDKVKRIKNSFQGMRKGDVDIIIGVRNRSVDLEKYGTGHSKSSLELVKENQIDFKNCRVRVGTITQSKKIQKILFKLGFAWGSIGIFHENKKFLFFSEDKSIYYSNDEEHFKNHKFKEVKAKDILDLKMTISRKKSYYIGLVSFGGLDEFMTYTEKEFKKLVGLLSIYQNSRIFKVKLTELQAEEIKKYKSQWGGNGIKAGDLIRKNKSIIWLSKEVFK